MGNEEILQLWIDTLKTYGPNPFYEKIYEELFELGQALAHFRYDKVDYIDLAEEIADVAMQLEKIISVHSHVNLGPLVLDIKKQKYLELAKKVYGKDQ